MKRALTAIALGILGLWVGPSWASAQTSFRFVAWGGSRGVSSGVDTAVLSNVSNQVKGISPQPVFTIFEGDLCYSWDSSCTSTGSSGWKYAVNNGSPGNGTFNITFPLEGNHDTNASLWDSYWNGHSRATVTAIGGSNFNYYSGDSENRTYSFDYGNSHFCLLDNQGGAASTLSSGQISWLDSDIAAAEARGVVHTFINTHGPIWPINELLDTPSSSLIAVINKHPSISASLSAHEHVLGYAHIDSSRIAAVTHPWEEFVSGGAGAPLFSCTAGLSEYCTSSYGFVSVDVSGSSFTVNLYLQGAGSVPAETWTFTKPTAAFTLTPTSVSFGNQTVGTTSAAQAITVNNGTASSVSISSIAITGTNSGDFTRTTNCGSSLAAGAQCAINVTFKPTASGSRTAAVTVTDSATGSPQTATLSGTGVTSTATLSPTSLTFGSQPVGATSTTQAFTLTNSGNVSLAITSIAISGDFAQTNNCGTSVAAGANCTINMTFTPTATGTRNGTLTVTDNATNSPQTASLTGTGTTSTAALAPTSLTFASQQVGSTSLAQAVALTNSGTTTVSITTIAIAGANPGDFGQTNNCGNSLAVEGNCTINVTFSPSATGTRTATLMVADNASNSPQTASLSGTGVSSGGSSAASLSPPALNFGNQQVSVTTPAQAVPLSNSGSAALSITSIAITGTNGADFAQTNNCGNSVAAGVTCTISVTFTPAATGTRSGTLTVTDNATNSPQTASLTGTGTTAGGSGPALVQVQNNIDTSGAAFGSFSVNITTNAGDFLVAFCRESSNGTDNFTVTDSAGQTWAQTSSGYRNEGSTGPRSGMFYVANSAAVNSVTVNYTTTGGVIKPGIVVFEISGAVTSGVADSSVSNGTASTTTSTSGSLTTTNANDLLIFATDTAGNVGGWAAGAGYLIPNNKLTTGASGSNVRMAMQYAVVTSTQTNMTTLMTYTGTNWNGNIFAAFKVTPSTGGSPSVNLLPSSMTFAGQTVGSTSAVQAIALQNGTSSSLTLSSIAISGTNSGDFAQTNNCGSTLAAGASCSIDVTFTPVAAGKRSGTLTVTDTATNSPQTASLTGAGVTLVAGPLPLFGHVVIVVEENHGYSQVEGSSSMPYLNSLIGKYGLAANYIADTHPSIDNYFMLTVGKIVVGQNWDSWNCTTTTGVISDDNIVRELLAAGKTWKTYVESIPSTGYTGCDSGSYLKHHNPFAYLNDVANTSQKNSMLDFTNNFANDLKNGSLPQYSFIVPNVNDDAHDGTLAQADSWLQTNIDPLVQSALFQKDCLLIIVFDDDQNSSNPGCTMTQIQSGTWCGGQVAAVIVSPFLVSPGFQSWNSYHHENVLRLMAQGIGLATSPGLSSTAANMGDFFSADPTTGRLSLWPTSLSFGNHQVGTTSTAQAVTLTNSQSTALTITSIAVTGANGGDFAQTNNCGSSVAAGANCTINVNFTPTAIGTRSATLTVTDNASNSPQTASLSGAGTALPSLSPTSLTFSSQNVGTTSAAQAVMLSNPQSTALSISSIAMTGTNGSSFAQTNNCGTSLAAGAKCTINVTFTPTTTGTLTATLTVTDNASNSPQTASLSGTGTVIASGPAVVQIQNNIDTSGTAYTSFSVNITTKAGDLLIAFCRESSNGTDNFTVTDSAGQTWTETSSGYNNESSTGPRNGMFYVANSAGVTSVTAHFTTSGGVIKPGIMVMEISGAAISGVADGSVHDATASTTTSTSGSLTTTNASDILIFATDAAGNETGWTAGAGYAIPNNKLMIGASGSNVRMAMQYAVVTSTQTNATTSMTYTNSNWNGNIFAAFK